MRRNREEENDRGGPSLSFAAYAITDEVIPRLMDSRTDGRTEGQSQFFFSPFHFASRSAEETGGKKIKTDCIIREAGLMCGIGVVKTSITLTNYFFSPLFLFLFPRWLSRNPWREL